MHQELHWLDIPERVNYKLGVLTQWPTGFCSARRQCTYQTAAFQSSSYMAASTLRCTSSADRTSTSSQHLRSAIIYCRWSDDVSLTLYQTWYSAVSTSTFEQSLKTPLFSAYQHVQRIMGVSRNALNKCTKLTYSTYLWYRLKGLSAKEVVCVLRNPENTTRFFLAKTSRCCTKKIKVHYRC